VDHFPSRSLPSRVIVSGRTITHDNSPTSIVSRVPPCSSHGSVTLDRTKSQEAFDLASETFGDLLEIRKEFKETLQHAGALNTAMILKDTHTVENEPDRFARWVAIGRKELGQDAVG